MLFKDPNLFHPFLQQVEPSGTTSLLSSTGDRPKFTDLMIIAFLKVTPRPFLDLLSKCESNYKFLSRNMFSNPIKQTSENTSNRHSVVPGFNDYLLRLSLNSLSAS